MADKPEQQGPKHQDREHQDREQNSPALKLVQDTLARLRFGAINLIVHDGHLVQVDVTERARFPN